MNVESMPEIVVRKQAAGRGVYRVVILVLTTERG